MRYRFAIVMGSVAALFLILSTSSTMGQGKKGTGGQGGFGGFGGFGGGKGGDPNQVFDFLAKGRNFFLLSENQRLSNLGLAEFLEKKGITSGQVTRALFVEFNEQLRGTMGGGFGAGMRTMATDVDQKALDTFGADFLELYERARTLKKTLEEQKASAGKSKEKVLEALDTFLKAGKELEQAVKQRAKTQAVETVKREVDSALGKIEKSTHDTGTALEALEEIERYIKDVKAKLQPKLPKGITKLPRGSVP